MFQKHLIYLSIPEMGLDILLHAHDRMKCVSIFCIVMLLDPDQINSALCGQGPAFSPHRFPSVQCLVHRGLVLLTNPVSSSSAVKMTDTGREGSSQSLHSKNPTS